jgi:hypothetical protein
LVEGVGRLERLSLVSANAYLQGDGGDDVMMGDLVLLREEVNPGASPNQE